MLIKMSPLLHEEANSAVPQRSFAAVARGYLSFALAVLIESRRARAAENLHRRLKAMSDEDLARTGLRRSDIATEVHRRLYGGDPMRSHDRTSDL